jgi:hypothetical protein
MAVGIAAIRATISTLKGLRSAHKKIKNIIPGGGEQESKEVQAEIKGVKLATKKLNMLGDRLRKRILTKAVRAALKPVQTQAKKNVPIGKARGKSDRAKLVSLRKAIRTKIRSGARYTKNGVGYGVVGQFYNAKFDNNADTPAGMRGKPLARFARKVEFDRSPYMRAALREKKVKALSEYRTTLDTEMQKATSIIGRIKRAL